MLRTFSSLAALAILLPALDAVAAPTPAQLCEKRSAAAARSCAKRVAASQGKCYRTANAACAPGDPKIVAALAKLESKVTAACPDAAAVSDAGYGTLMTPAALVARLQDACTGQAASLAARSFGGPHAAVRSTATPDDQKCLDYAFKRGRALINYTFAQQSACITKAHAGGACVPADVATKIAAREASTVTKISAKCPTLAALVTVDPTEFTRRASAQARCFVALAHGPTAPLALDCGPRAAAVVPPLATDTQVVLPFATWGSRCGNGSDYAFNVRLAPPGQPVNRVVVHIQGGGFCADGPSCASKPSDLFEATTEGMPNNGLLSSTAADNPFRDWTKVSLPYCTQDLHIGNGVTNAFPEITVERYGAHNVRAALSWLRDVIWTQMNAVDPDGYRNDSVRMVFSGSSAGGYGVMYNYHWVLDDLAWPHTTAVPDAALAMDNGLPLGVITFGAFALLPTTPGWNVAPVMPPYCRTAACAEIKNTLQLATAPRLLAVPEQQILHVANQVDNTQVNTTLFPDLPTFVNALRTRYCAAQGTPGLYNFLTATSTHVHGQLNNNTRYNGAAVVDGTLLRDWLGDAMTAPETVEDKVAEGTLVTDVPGVLPFACSVVASPGGAFLD